MFTQGTRQFGVWKMGHPSVSRYAGRPTQALLLAYGVCAFLTWFLFILTLKIRGDFFLVESMNLPLERVDAPPQSGKTATRGSLTIAIRPENDGRDVRAVIDSGESFFLPGDLPAMETFLRQRVNEIELVALLRREISPGIGTADLWVDRRVGATVLQPLTNLLVSLGFDTLRYAVDARQASEAGDR